MVSNELQTATNDLVSVFTTMDPVAIGEGALGLGLGLATGDFFAQLAEGFVSDQSQTVKFFVQLVGRAVPTVGLAYARQMVSNPLVSMVLGLAAVGSGITGGLQVIDALARTAAKLASGQSLMGGAPQIDRSGSGQVDQNGYTGEKASAFA